MEGAQDEGAELGEAEDNAVELGGGGFVER